MAEKKWFYNFGRRAFILLLLAPTSAIFALVFGSTGDGWAAAYGPINLALNLFMGFLGISFIAGLLGIFHSNKFQTYAYISVFFSSTILLFFAVLESQRA